MREQIEDIEYSAGQDLLRGLNPEQKEAVLHNEGPLLILAGAGSGKTRVITHRIAYLVQARGVSPREILAITFTNKAAKEMQTRVEELLGTDTRGMWIGTFHSMMARVLRRFAEHLGFTQNFSIADTAVQLAEVKAIVKELNLDEKTFEPRRIHNAISTAKNQLVSPEAYRQEVGTEYWKSKVATVYAHYQERLKRNNLMDFDDLLYYAVKLFQAHEDVLRIYQERFRYIMVDEYQDTNGAQYELVRLLSMAHENLCVVGDDDQSIYSFRGADIQNILDFEKDFDHCKIIKLEQNYRSSGNILQAANTVIGNNSDRKDKKLWTASGTGEKIIRVNATDEQMEAQFISAEISRMVHGGEANYRDFGILYRLNALSRNLEFALQRAGIPFKIYGGLRFFDRKEIKDVLAYLYLITSPRDDASFRRAVQTPRRGIGQVTIDEIQRLALEHNASIMEICVNIEKFPNLSRNANRVQVFVQEIARMQKTLLENKMSLAEYIEYVQNESGLVQEIIDKQDKGREEAYSRLENMKELLSEAITFQNLPEDSNAWDFTAEELGELATERDQELANDEETLLQKLLRFLDQAALQSDLDLDESGEEENYVKLMTIHSAKGLEFDNVFVVGMEEGIFPGYRSLMEPGMIEEERRLAYVSITRARKKLFMSTSAYRLLFGRTEGYVPSRFLEELPEETYTEIGQTSRTRNTTSRMERDYEEDLRRPTERKDIFGLGSKKSPLDDLRSKEKVVSQIHNNTKGGLTPDEIQRGDRVRHMKYGAGTVRSVEPVAGDALLLIHFDGAGEKRLLANMAKLQRTGE